MHLFAAITRIFSHGLLRAGIVAVIAEDCAIEEEDKLCEEGRTRPSSKEEVVLAALYRDNCGSAP